MKLRRLLALAGVPLVAGCVYFNSLYNARQRLEAGDAARLAGREEEARIAYADAIRKAARGYRSEPDGRWSDDVLYVLGRAYLRRGELARARAALEETVRSTDDPGVRRGASLYLGVTLYRAGDAVGGLRLMNDALGELPRGPLSAEGHLWRARLHLAAGRADEGLWDLGRAAVDDPRLAVPAQLERLRWGVAHDDRAEARRAAEDLLTDDAGSNRADSLEAVVDRAAERWGAGAAAELLSPARSGSWPPGPRERVLLRRSRLLVAAGDTLAAETEAGRVAGGVGPEAVDARLLIARIRLARVQEVEELTVARTILLPAAGDAEVARLALDIRTVELLDEMAETGGPEALFAAAELARDALGAPALARSLFLRYAAVDPDGAWVGKAILAALATTPDARSDPALRDRLDARAGDPYVRAARERYVGEAVMTALEEGLQSRMAGLLEEARAEARRRDLRLRGDSVGVHPR